METDRISQEALTQLERMMRLFNIELVYDDDRKHVRDWQETNLRNLAAYLEMDMENSKRMTMVGAKNFKMLILKRLGRHAMKKIDPANNDYNAFDTLIGGLRL